MIKTNRFSWWMLAVGFVLSVEMANAAIIYSSYPLQPFPLQPYYQSGTQLGRLTRDGIPSDWSAPKLFPGVINSGVAYAFETFQLNVGVYPYIQIDFDEPSSTVLFASAYLGTYDPFDMSLNYLGDAGSSGDPFGNPGYFQVLVPAYSNLILVVNEATTGAGAGKNFAYMVEGFFDADYRDAVPEPSTILLICTGMALLPLFRRKGSKG